MAPDEGFVPCKEAHPKTGDTCLYDAVHAQHPDPLVKQHQAPNGIKWPSLQELDPKEGYTGPFPYRL